MTHDQHCRCGGSISREQPHAVLVIMEILFERAVKLALKALSKSDLVLTLQQKEALKSVVNGKNTFVNLPTAHGKSVIF